MLGRMRVSFGLRKRGSKRGYRESASLCRAIHPQKKRIPLLRPYSSWIVTHAQQVPAPTEVGLRRNQRGGVLAHPIEIGNHHPVIGIYIPTHEKLIHPVRMHFIQKEKASQYHKTLYMMHITPTDAGAGASYPQVESQSVPLPTPKENLFRAASD